MLRHLRIAAASLLMIVFASSAYAQGMNIRGTIEAFDGKTVTVRTKDGSKAMVDVPDKTRIATTKPFTMKDVKPGMTLGVTTVKRKDGKIVAIDLRPIPPAARQGLFPYDLAPQSTMTNAKYEGGVTAAGGQEITLNHGTGTVKVLVTDQTAMSQAAPGSRSDVKQGETIYVFATKGDGGRLTAVRLQVSKDGVKPTQ
ncbi:MAG: hypothetical protein AB7O43_07990 [Hyphomicrobiaceae bacterium]